MSWRPENWSNPYPSGSGRARTYGENYRILEAGADAMLKAVLTALEKEIRAHTSVVCAQEIIGGELWRRMAAGE